MFFINKLYYLYKIHKDKKQGIKLASYPVVCNELRLSDCCIAINYYFTHSKSIVCFDIEDENNLIENNIPNHWLLRLGFLIVAELGITNYDEWKKEFHSRANFGFGNYDNLYINIWNHKYQSIDVCEKYRDYQDLYKYFDTRKSICQLADNKRLLGFKKARQLGIELFSLKDVFCEVNYVKIILCVLHCENCNSKYNEGDVVINISKNDDYNPIVCLVDTENIIDKDFGRFDLSSAISDAVHWHYEKHLARETRETMTVHSRTNDGKECYLIKSFEIQIDYDD